MNRKYIYLFGLLSLFATTSLEALTLDQARQQGLVTETAEGYVRANNASAEVTALVNSINAQRRAEYQNIAAKEGTSVDAVGRIAADKIRKQR